MHPDKAPEELKAPWEATDEKGMGFGVGGSLTSRVPFWELGASGVTNFMESEQYWLPFFRFGASWVWTILMDSSKIGYLFFGPSTEEVRSGKQNSPSWV